MKIVKNYKRLKKWAKTLFVTLLTICIVFTSTGVATLFAYADPADDNNEINDQFNTESGSETTPSIAPQEHEHIYVTSYESNNDGTHKVIKTCECEDKIEETENCSIVDGICANCGYIDSSFTDEESFENINNSPAERGGSINLLGLSNGPLDDSCFSQFFSNEPSVANETLVYDGTSHILFNEGILKNTNFNFNFNKATYRIENVRKTVSYTPDYNGSGTDAQLYNMSITIDYSGKKLVIPAEIPISGSITIDNYNSTINTRPISECTGNVSYSPLNSIDCNLAYNGHNLVLGNDYSINESSLPEVLVVGDTYSGVEVTGIGNFSGTKSYDITIPDIPLQFDGTSLSSSYTDQVNIAPNSSEIKISLSQDGPFKDSIIYTTPGTNSFPIYLKNSNGKIHKKTINALTINETIPIRYDNDYKKDTYINKVSITASGYMIGTSETGPFSSTYVYTKIGEDQSFYLYFVDKNNPNAVPIKKLINGISILYDGVNLSGESSGKIIVGDYSSDKIAATEDTVYMTDDAKSIEIQATNDSAGIKSIEYATANEAYNTVSDILGAVIDKKMSWKPYSNDGKPTLPKDSALYIYARITDQQDNYNYLSTGKIIYDTIDPVITNAILAAKENGSNDNVLAVTAKDTLSGIKEFYMLYEEKNSDSEVPKKSKIIEDGKKFDVDTNDGQNAGGSYKLSDLIEDTTYIFYIVAKDEVGNISEIKTIESKGKGSSKSYGADSSSSATASSGLTPAPNGIAGPGNNKTPKTGTTGIPQKTSQEVNVSSLDREINRIPYISDATGDTKIGIDATGGWDKITNEVKNASPGISMDVEMSGFSVVPDKVFSTMMGKNLNVKFLMPEDVEWIINGQNIKSTSGTDLDLGVRIGAKNIPSDMLNPVVGAYPHTEIELKHNGTFGFSGILRIPLGKSNAGLYAYLYYYDTKEKEMKLMQSTQISSTGYAEFEFNHASDYSIVIRGEEMMTVGTAKSNNALEGEDTNVDNTSAYKTFRLTDFAGSRASVRMWLFMIAIISAVMCGLILYMPGLKDEETLEKV